MSFLEKLKGLSIFIGVIALLLSVIATKIYFFKEVMIFKAIIVSIILLVIAIALVLPRLFPHRERG